ncbi:hypothetical protein PoB_004298200 [Plakobranchus ocellatus]|uniref:Uncharacterized protein n=1 Tax=Plakobranchus ocellatus TaxID=259542 RepID=A0AAV4BAN2_9GAST|nr:hypothetical protein PoB_004298200 [Plakobranchus ocellatus]
MAHARTTELLGPSCRNANNKALPALNNRQIPIAGGDYCRVERSLRHAPKVRADPVELAVKEVSVGRLYGTAVYTTND